METAVDPTNQSGRVAVSTLDPSRSEASLKIPVIAVAAVAVALLIGCSVDHGNTAARNQQNIAATESDPAPETFALGSSLTAGGYVPQQATGDSFSRGGELFVCVDVAGASTDQEIAVEWRDQNGRVIRREARHVAEGARYVAFSSGRTAGWSRGPHRAVITINGRTVSEKTFALI